MMLTLPTIDARAVVRDVSEAEYARLLGLPSSAPIAERFRRPAADALNWYAEHGTPRVWTRFGDIVAIGADAVHVRESGGSRRLVLRSRRLATKFRRAGASDVIVAGATAGPEIDAESKGRWSAHPVAAWYLDRLGAVIVESLVGHVRRVLEHRLSLERPIDDLQLLSHDAPGYSGWELSDQGRVMRFLSPPEPLKLTEGLMLEPLNSMLFVFAVAPASASKTARRTQSACTPCSLSACYFRRD